MSSRLIWRIVIPVFLVVLAASLISGRYVDRLLSDWFSTDVGMRATVVMNSMSEVLPQILDKNELPRLKRYLSRVTEDERLLAVVVCRPNGTLVYQTDRAPPQVNCGALAGADAPASQVLTAPSGSIHLARYEIKASDGQTAIVVLVHDLSFVDRRSNKARYYMVGFAAFSFLVFIALPIAGLWWLLKHWGKLLVRDIQGRRFLDDAESPPSSLPILSQVRKALREIEHDQRQEIDFRENWTPKALQHVVKEHLDSPQMIIVSNREPYIHDRGPDGRPVVQVPASGMVTALEPVMRACSGVWIAHGSGTADRDVVDLHDRVKVPPADPSYTLRRVWLSEEEEEGFYYGFANEGLWPLCHLAYVRPAFRDTDWRQYEAVNRRFADTVVKEAKDDKPVVFVQDYHFAVLPGLVRDRLPGATIVVFWHIPWPNVETFGICPWKLQLLNGMLMADILGFHTRHHCQNFLETVDRYIECQIDREHMTVTIRGHVCKVAPYPISIEWPPRWVERLPSIEQSAAQVRKRYGIAEGVRIGVGVERWDFTKGILERLRAFELLLESSPRWRGRLCLLQVAAPSRSKLPAYQRLREETEQAVVRLNERFGTAGYKPVVLIAEHQDPIQVFELFRIADFCLVNSLHDGMNLVAKEFVAARDDEDGVLILSTFAGASRELLEALLVNPYDIRETADAIEQALNMGRDERRERMRLMRRTVKENNVYRWAGRMLMDASRVIQRKKLVSRGQPSADGGTSSSTALALRRDRAA